MKNVKFVSKSELDNYVYNLWSTDFFRNEQLKEGSIINLLVKHLREKCFYSFQYSDVTERNHMPLWIYHIAEREYDNPYVKDLYYFHEFYHLISFPEKEMTDYEEWKAAMWHNELEASLMSEVFIYYCYPELRANTFNHKIWFDDMAEMFGYEKVFMTEEMFTFQRIPETFQKIKERRMALREGLESSLETEDWVRSFNNKDPWFEFWKKDFKKLESFRHQYEKEVKIDDLMANKNMLSNLEKVSEHNVPFYNVSFNSYYKILTE